MGNAIDSYLEQAGFTVAPGNRVTGFLEVGGYSPQLDVPVALLRGKQDGPIAVIIAAIHGGEYHGIEACRRMIKELDPNKMRGLTVFVPVANRSAYRHRSHNGAPPDGQNLAKVFPGDPEGKALERVAYAITTRLIHNCDLLLDLHGADALEDLSPHLYVPTVAANPNTSEDWDAWTLAEVYGIELVEDVGDKLSGGPSGFAAEQGIVAILPESGFGPTISDEAVVVHTRGISNVLKRVGILQGEIEPGATMRRVRHDRVRSPATGCFASLVRAGDIVEAGQIIGEVTDFFGENRKEIIAPVPGEIAFVKYSMATNDGDAVFSIAVSLA